MNPFSLATLAARARANQQIGDGEVVDVRGPVQRGRAVALRRVHVDALLQQRRERPQHPCVRTALDEAQASAAATSRPARRRHDAMRR